jgi:hypothetical protein
MVVQISITSAQPLLPKMLPSALGSGKGTGTLFLTPGIPHVVEKAGHIISIFHIFSD